MPLYNPGWNTNTNQNNVSGRFASNFQSDDPYAGNMALANAANSGFGNTHPGGVTGANFEGSGQTGAGQWQNGQWVSDQAPFGFGNTDPMGDARRAAAMAGTPQTAMQNAQNAGFGGTQPGGYTGTIGGQTFANGVPTSSSTSASAAGIQPAGGSSLGAAANFAPTFQQGVTITNPDNTGGTITQNANPFQWGTPEMAQQLAQMFGGRAFGQNIDMPGGNYSSPQQMIGFNNGRQINAGLAGDLLGKYGSSPDSYGRYLVDRDVNQDYHNAPSYDTWARSQPGFKENPLLSNTHAGPAGNTGFTPAEMADSASRATYSGGAPGGMTGGMNGGMNPGQQFGAQPFGGATGLGGWNPGQDPFGRAWGIGNMNPQQTGGQQSFFSQIGPIMQLLQMLGGHQRPPILGQGPQSAPFYSKFA